MGGLPQPTPKSRLHGRLGIFTSVVSRQKLKIYFLITSSLVKVRHAVVGEAPGPAFTFPSSDPLVSDLELLGVPFPWRSSPLIRGPRVLYSVG